MNGWAVSPTFLAQASKSWMQLHWRESFWKIFIQNGADVAEHFIFDNGKATNTIFSSCYRLRTLQTVISSCEFGHSWQHLSISVNKCNHCDSYSSINILRLVSTDFCITLYFQTQKRQNFWLQDMTKSSEIRSTLFTLFYFCHALPECVSCLLSFTQWLEVSNIFICTHLEKPQIHSFPFLSSHHHQH